MKINLVRKSKIRNNQVISKEDILDYLSEQTNYQENEFIEINGKDIQLNSLSITIENIENVEEIDLVIIKGYPFYKNQTMLFFNVDNIIFESSDQATLKLKLNIFQSFSLDEIFKNQRIKIDYSHLKEENEFFNLNTLTLKSTNFFQTNQLTPSEIETEFKTIDSSLYTENELEILEKTGIKFWIIVLQKISGDEVEFQPNYNHLLKEANPATLSLPWRVLFFPLGIANFKIKSSEIIRVIDGSFSYKSLSTDINTLDILIIDFPPSRFMKWNEESFAIEIEDIDNLQIVSGKVEEDEYFYTIKVTGKMDVNSFQAPILIDDNSRIWNWKPANWNESMDWLKENEIILNFDPFLNLRIGFWGEDSHLNWSLVNNNKTQIPIFDSLGNENEIIFYRTFSIDIHAWQVIDEDINSFNKELLFGNPINKISRDMSLPISIDLWKAYNEEKSFRRLSDFGGVIAGTTKGAISSSAAGPEAAIAGGVLGFSGSMMKTVKRNQRIKSEPNPIVSTASNTLSELFQTFNSKALTIEKYNDLEEESIAFDFHKHGYYWFGKYKMVQEIMHQKKLFQYLQISSNQDKKIFKNWNVQNKQLHDNTFNQLEVGIHIWNYKKEFPEDIKSNMFDFNKSNPSV